MDLSVKASTSAGVTVALLPPPQPQPDIIIQQSTPPLNLNTVKAPVTNNPCIGISCSWPKSSVAPSVPSVSSSGGNSVERVSCIVGEKERHLGRVFANGNSVYYEYICQRGISYKPGDSVYLESSSRRDPFETFNICTIQDFFRHKRDGCLYVRVKGFYRLQDIPESQIYRYQKLQVTAKDHNNLNNLSTGVVSSVTADSVVPLIINNPLTQNRELVAYESERGFDTYPVAALRGVNCVQYYRDLASCSLEFVPSADRFFYILAGAQGEIRVGASFQAKLPECHPDTPPERMPERNPEVCLWRPKFISYDLSMYVGAVHSMFAYRSMCHTGSIDDGCTDYKDDTLQKALDALYAKDYNVQEALHYLLGTPEEHSSAQKRWSEDDSKRFIKGLRQWGKNFFRIRKELLAHRTNAELVEYYYLWKKTTSASRVAKRSSRRQTNVVRRMKGRPNRTLTSSDYVDVTPSNSDEERDSEDSEKDLTTYQCSNCSATESKDWHPTTKDKTTVLCTDCRLFYKKYGELRPTEDRENAAAAATPSAFQTKSSFEGDPAQDKQTSAELDANLSLKNGPTTRRTNISAGRPKSSLGNSSPEAEKGRRSPGAANIYSLTSTENKQNKKTRKPSAVEKEADIAFTGNVATANDRDKVPSRKRRKTSASDTPSDSSVPETDPVKVEEAAPLTIGAGAAASTIPNSAPCSHEPVKPCEPLGPLPPAPTIHTTTAPPSVNLPMNHINLSLADMESRGSAFTARTLSPPAVPLIKSEAIPEITTVKAEPVIKREVDSPTTSLGKGVINLNLESVKVERPEKERHKSNKENLVKQESDCGPDVVCDVAERGRGIAYPRDPSPEPKADHHQRYTSRNAILIRVWNRGENNSCARTDLTFLAKPESLLAQKRAAQQAASASLSAAVPSASTAAPSKPTKSPIPTKDGKRTPGTSSSSSTHAASGERERDNRSGAPGSSSSAALPRNEDTPPRGTLARHSSAPGPGMSPHIPPESMHHPGPPFGHPSMSPGMFHPDRYRMEQERERMIRSVPPGMMPMDAALMEMQQRSRFPGPMGGMGMYGPGPGMTPHQQQAMASMINAEQQQRELAMAAMMQPHHPQQHPHGMHAMHPEQLAHEQAAIFNFLQAQGAGGPFARNPYMPGHPGGGPSPADMFHPMNRPPSMEEYNMANMASQHQAQIMRQAQMMEQEAQLRHIMQMQNPHHDFRM